MVSTSLIWYMEVTIIYLMKCVECLLETTFQRRWPLCIQCKKQARHKKNMMFPLHCDLFIKLSSEKTSLLRLLVCILNTCCLHPTWKKKPSQNILWKCVLHLPLSLSFLFLLHIICNKAQGSIFISLPTTCANLQVTEDCWMLSPFIKWCKTAREKSREGITEYFLNFSRNLHTWIISSQINSNDN